MNFKSFEDVDGSLDDTLACLEKRKLEQVQESLEEGKRLIGVKMKNTTSRQAWVGFCE